ncbi:MAG: hypothetical protein JW987_10275 [Anaerolineaceae bacterium]|nr:hypothetical protein [Anaerolineaceae bacterium]
MKYDPQNYRRRSIRLPGYDYSQPGAYFVTIVTYRREALFGEIVQDEMQLNDAGRIVWDIWQSLPERYPQVQLGAAVVMPNHFHAIVEIVAAGAIHELPLPELSQQESRLKRRRMTIPMVVGYFKMNTAKQINLSLDSPGVPIWQRNYYEHVIEDDEEYRRIHLYIESNPSNWLEDDENAS